MAKQLPAKISLQNFGKAMSQLDLSSVPPHKRQRAVMDHLMRIQEDTITDKQKATEIAISRRLREAQDAYDLPNTGRLIDKTKPN